LVAGLSRVLLLLLGGHRHHFQPVSVVPPEAFGDNARAPKRIRRLGEKFYFYRIFYYVFQLKNISSFSIFNLLFFLKRIFTSNLIAGII
jgi:hypothetical protein